jgi:hypothetical protein
MRTGGKRCRNASLRVVLFRDDLRSTLRLLAEGSVAALIGVPKFDTPEGGSTPVVDVGDGGDRTTAWNAMERKWETGSGKPLISLNLALRFD